MKRLFLLLIGILSCSFGFSQPLAPNFTVTTSDGNVIHLYEDLLNQGKTVVIKFFFTTCPPCNAMAPLMEPFYQEWGGGDGDVEFISLSIMNFDMNSNVAAYKLAKGHTFPGVGKDGGSITACQPYLNNTFGQFTGTPTFAVIAPDRTVIFDPRGSNYEATIDSVDVAIRSTGATKPPVPFTVGGTVKDVNGNGISGAIVHLQELGTEFTATTGANGQFSFVAMMEPRLTYTLTADKDNNYSNGVTTFDLIQMQRHVLSIAPFMLPQEFLASDANHSGGITTQDVIELRRILLHTADDLANNTSWIFINEDYSFGNPEFPYPETYTTHAALLHFSTKTTTPLHLRGIKIGDVNGSADPHQ